MRDPVLVQPQLHLGDLTAHSGGSRVEWSCSALLRGCALFNVILLIPGLPGAKHTCHQLLLLYSDPLLRATGLSVLFLVSNAHKRHSYFH